MSTAPDPHTEPDDDNMLSPSESTDSDELRNRDGDQTVEPPENWHGANQFGMNEAEAEQGESLDDKLDAEQPDVGEVEGTEPDPGDGTSFFPVADDDELDTDLSDVATKEEE